MINRDRILFGVSGISIGVSITLIVVILSPSIDLIMIPLDDPIDLEYCSITFNHNATAYNDSVILVESDGLVMHYSCEYFWNVPLNYDQARVNTLLELGPWNRTLVNEQEHTMMMFKELQKMK